jgi:hypothetical protein
VLGTQETSCILIAGLLERDTFDLFLLEFDKPWVIHLRETCCCSTNLCTWRLNTIYKNRSVHRHQIAKWSGVCAPKRPRGLGIQDLELKNTALLGKWLFRLLTRDGVWQTLLRGKYVSKALSQVFLETW